MPDPSREKSTWDHKKVARPLEATLRGHNKEAKQGWGQQSTTARIGKAIPTYREVKKGVRRCFRPKDESTALRKEGGVTHEWIYLRGWRPLRSH